MTRGRRHHVRPDIVIFKGFHRDAGDVRTEEGDRIMQKAVVIDPKIEMRESDVEQLAAYTRLFPEGVSVFIEKLKEAIREICSS